MFGRLKAFASRVVPEVDDLRKFVGMLAASFALGFTICSFSSDLFYARREAGAERTINGMGTCDIAENVENIRRTYNSQMQPLINRVLEISRETANTELLPMERQIKKEAADLISDEITRIHEAHERSLSLLNNACRAVPAR